MQTLKYASIKKSSIYKTSNEKKYTINKRFAGRQIVKKIYSYLFDVMIHNQFLETKPDLIETNTFHYTTERKKLLSRHVADLIIRYEYDYGITVRRETHVIVCGEEDFFEAVRDDSHRQFIPFFTKEASFPLDIMRNGMFEGFMIHVCPGVSGMMILPKVVIQK
jgi:hypothetical protein